MDGIWVKCPPNPPAGPREAHFPRPLAVRAEALWPFVHIHLQGHE